mmetsp:Transcript_25746/g.42861  ORF Transcript_25746/g.42861 Transcript_25746/m.42861 type:complete len:199 (+) Transcript_25746:324-920(+)
MSKDKGEQDQLKKHALSVGTLVEFAEKSRVHVGRVAVSESKSNGNARYDVVDLEGKHYSIADKAVTYSVHAPTNDSAANKLLVGLAHAQLASEHELRNELDLSADLLEMAWEETIEGDDTALTPTSLVQLVHSHTADALESYMAWRLLRLDVGHVFFRELKENGRVVAFKAKARKGVDAAKRAFCDNHEDEDEICFAI